MIKWMSSKTFPITIPGQSIAELTKETYQTMLDNREFFQAEEKLQRVKESLRPAGNGNKIGEMSGSFKKLDLD
jgi:hypothetical protein